MIQAELAKQLMIRVNNKVGSLAQIVSVISSRGINMVALCAYEIGQMVAIMFVTEDNNAAKQLLEKHGVAVVEEEVIILTVDNKAGALQHVTDKIAEAGIDLALMYGSAAQSAETCSIVLIAKNNLDVMMLIKTELERS
ncbi:MAG TPA: hypothetical protein VI749_02680 [Candidatus Omnitrophota bacterium]|nr:hypothetical protein [Candidatus Omnitrophota bacterium]